MKNELEEHLESIVKGNIDLFLLDPQREANITQLEKSLRDVRQEQEVDHQWHGFIEDLELAAATGRGSRPAPRLRSEYPALDEPVWRPGDDPDFGLEKSAGRKKNLLRAWFTEALATGRSASELVQHAERGGDPETASALRELAHEMQE